MHRAQIVLSLFICCAFACDGSAGCSPQCQSNISPRKMPAAVKAESEASQLPARREVAQSVNDFAFDLHREIAGDGNLVYAPLSVDSVLSMTLLGADGSTAEDIERALRARDVDDYHAKLGALSWSIAPGGKGSVARIADDVWVSNDVEIKDSYEQALRDSYGATFRTFHSGSPTAAAQRINRHVSQVTGGRIDDIVQAGALEDPARVVLTNAVHFEANWEKPFEEERTHKRRFYLNDEESVSVDMMFQEDRFLYAHDDGVRMIEFPYDGGDFSAIGILPTEGSLDELEARLDGHIFATLRESMQEVELDVALPRIQLRSTTELRDALEAMGMERAFDAARADFSGLSERPLYISQVRHAAFIELDEQGTRAAAATGEMAEEAAAEMPEFIANEPFLFFVTDNRSGAIVFVARVVNPADTHTAKNGSETNHE